MNKENLINNSKVSNKNKIWNKITYINFVLSILVLILHARFNMYIDISSKDFLNLCWNKINEFIQVLADCAVPNFFCISSMLFFRNLDMKNYKEKITKRIKSILIPYLIFSIFFTIVYIVIKNIPVIRDIIWSPIKSIEIKNLIVDIIFAKSDNALWFLRTLMIWFLISPIIYLIIKKTKIISIILTIALIILNIEKQYEYTSLIVWLPVLMLGAYIGMYYWDKIKEVPLIKNKKKLVSILSLVIYILFIIYVMSRGRKTYYIYRLVSPIFIWIIFDMFKYEDEPKWYFKISFYTFCIHYPIVIAQRNLLVHFFGKETVTLIWMYILSIIVALLIIYLTAFLLRNKCKKVWNLITGSR